MNRSRGERTGSDKAFHRMNQGAVCTGSRRNLLEVRRILSPVGATGKSQGADPRLTPQPAPARLAPTFGNFDRLHSQIHRDSPTPARKRPG